MELLPCSLLLLALDLLFIANFPGVGVWIFLVFFPSFVLSVEKYKVLPVLMVGRCMENQWDFDMENRQHETLD